MSYVDRISGMPLVRPYTRDGEHFRAGQKDAVQFCVDIAAEADAERAELMAALRPFAALLQQHNDQGADARPILGINEALITLGDLRRARALLARIEGTKT